MCLVLLFWRSALNKWRGLKKKKKRHFNGRRNVSYSARLLEIGLSSASLSGLFLPQMMNGRRTGLAEYVWGSVCSWGEGVRNLQPFTKNIRCGKCLVSPATQGAEAVGSCPSSASSVAVCAPSQSERAEGSRLKSNKVLKKKTFSSFSKGENIKPYKFLSKVRKIIL